MRAALSTSIAVGAVVATAGALVATPIAATPAPAIPPIQTHQIELASLPVGTLALALLQNQFENVSYVAESAFIIGSSAFEAGAAAVTAPITFVQALTAPNGDVLKAVGATAASIVVPLSNAGAAIIDPIYAIGARGISVLIYTAAGAVVVTQEAIGLGLMTVRGILAAPGAALENLAATGDIGQAIGAGGDAFNTYVGIGVADLAGSIDWARDVINNALNQPLVGTSDRVGQAKSAGPEVSSAPTKAAVSTSDASSTEKAQVFTDAISQNKLVSSQKFSTARKVADSLKDSFPDSAAAKSNDDTTQAAGGKHASDVDKASSTAGAKQNSAPANTSGKRTKHAK